MKVDNRRHSRARVKWPVVIQTPTGLLDGKTEDISIGGAFIGLSRELNSNHNLPLVIDVKGRFIPCNAQIVWSDERNFSDQKRFLGIGVSFTRMMLNDREFLYREISNHARVKKLSPIRFHMMARRRAGEVAHRRSISEQE